MPKCLLIVGAGDVAQRALPQLASAFEVLVLVRTPERAANLSTQLRSTQLRGPGITTLVGDLDDEGSLVAALGKAPPANCLLHCAPPPAVPASGTLDERTRNLLAALDTASLKTASQKTRGMVTRRVVYISTSGVYGDCAGARIDESKPAQPATGRAWRRVDAEQQLSQWCGKSGATLITLRVPGIYAADRLPLERLRRGTPVLRREDDVYTNHVHADDLAAICARALNESVPPGVYNASDDSEMLMGDWMDLVADRHGLARPPRIARSEAAEKIAAPMLSFMSESRRLVNMRLKRDMGYSLLYPTVHDGLRVALEERRPHPRSLSQGEREEKQRKALLPPGEGLG